MFKKIFSTSVSLVLISLINLVFVVLVSNTLGKGGVTEMGLIVLGISFIVMMSNIIGGTSLVYMTPRKNALSILIPSYGWVFISTATMGGIIFLLDLVPSSYFYWTILLGFLECLYSIHFQFFLGKKKVGWYNFFRVIQKALALIIFVLGGISIENYVIAIFLSSLVIVVVSSFFLFKLIDNYTISEIKHTFNELFTFGLWIQAANIFQLLNYRIVYIFIEKTMGEVLGIFIIAVQLAESIWIPSKALSIIQYSAIANEKDTQKHITISLTFLKISFIATVFLTGLLIIIPENFIGEIFGKDFKGAHEILIGLSLGIIAMGLNQMFSHFFSGKGIYKYNAFASGFGLIIICVSGYWLIDQYKLFGAAIATSISYICSTIMIGFYFKKYTNFNLKDLLITKEDFRRVRKAFNKKAGMK